MPKLWKIRSWQYVFHSSPTQRNAECMLDSTACWEVSRSVGMNKREPHNLGNNVNKFRKNYEMIKKYKWKKRKMLGLSAFASLRIHIFYRCIHGVRLSYGYFIAHNSFWNFFSLNCSSLIWGRSRNLISTDIFHTFWQRMLWNIKKTHKTNLFRAPEKVPFILMWSTLKLPIVSTKQWHL